MMPFLMRSRTESAVYFEQQVELTRTLEFVDEYNAANITPISIFPIILWATVQTCAERPELNRFTAGDKLWQRRGIWCSYVVKKSMSDDAGLATMKREFDPSMSFDQVVACMQTDKKSGRSDDKSHVDKELGLLLKLPGPLLRLGVRLIRLFDFYGKLPRSFIDPDPMFASAFFANLGSLQMGSAYHHLYEYGNCPIFCVIGDIQDTPVVEDGKVVVRKCVKMRWSYDERIHDGFYAGSALKALQAKIEDPKAAGAQIAVTDRSARGAGVAQ